VWLTAGHERAVDSLRRSLDEGRTAHAYLVTGAPQVGKGRLALDFAKALNCTSPDPPCGDCRACRRIEAWQHPDVEVVSVGGVCDEAEHDHRRDGSKDIKICQMRWLQRTIALRPFEGRMRVVTIDPAEALNIYAADALLKTLEEPPAQVTLMLLASQAVSLPETVISRARQIALSPAQTSTVRQVLVAREVDPARADLIARLSGGRIGWAIAHADDVTLLEERARRLARLELLMEAARTDRMLFAAELAARFVTSREETYSWLDLWRSWLRDLLLVAEGCEDLVSNTDQLPAIRQLARSFAVTGIVRALEALRECRQQLEENANARLALEVLALRLPSPVIREEAGR